MLAGLKVTDWRARVLCCSLLKVSNLQAVTAVEGSLGARRGWLCPPWCGWSIVPFQHCQELFLPGRDFCWACVAEPLFGVHFAEAQHWHSAWGLGDLQPLCCLGCFKAYPSGTVPAAHQWLFPVSRDGMWPCYCNQQHPADVQSPTARR